MLIIEIGLREEGVLLLPISSTMILLSKFGGFVQLETVELMGRCGGAFLTLLPAFNKGGDMDQRKKRKKKPPHVDARPSVGPWFFVFFLWHLAACGPVSKRVGIRRLVTFVFFVCTPVL